MINVTNIVQKAQPEILSKIEVTAMKGHATQTFSEISQNANYCISNIKRGIIKAQKTFPKLNRSSNACDYFGVYSAKGIQRRFGNQMALTWLKTRNENLVTFPPVVLVGAKDTRCIPKTIDKLMERGFGRLTITDKIFGDGINDGTHTVGMVYHKGKFYVLDSIPETYHEIKDCHERLIKFLDLNPKSVIFPNKPQQTMDEYTCNNWTHANLDALIDYLKTFGDTELTPKVLDEILPEDINKVLSKQFMETFKELRGRDLSDLVVEHYQKTHKYAGIKNNK